MNPAPPVMRIVRIRSPVDPARSLYVNQRIARLPDPANIRTLVGTSPNGVKSAHPQADPRSLRASARMDQSGKDDIGRRVARGPRLLGQDRLERAVGTYCRSLGGGDESRALAPGADRRRPSLGHFSA